MAPIRPTIALICTLLICAVVAGACTGDEEPPIAAETSPTAAPTADVEAIVETAVREALQSIPTQTPPPTPDIEAVVDSALEKAMGALLEALAADLSVDDESAEDSGLQAEPTEQPVEVETLLSPASGAFLSVGGSGFGGLPLSQELGEAGGLTVTAAGSVTASANEAHVIVIPEQFYGPAGPERLSHDDRDDVVENLEDIGIDVDDVEFRSGQIYDPETISVEVQVDDLPEIGDLILDAIEQVTRRSERSGVLFVVSGQNCDLALAAARQEAFARADVDSMDLGEALGVDRRGIIAAVEIPADSFSPVLLGLGKCGGGGFHPFQTTLMPFDAEPEVEVSVLMQITYGPGSEQTGGLTVAANGRVIEEATRAYVVVVPEQFYGPGGPEQLSIEDRAAVVQGLIDVGIGESDIDIESGQLYEPESITVQVSVEDLPEIGDQILQAVRDVLRRPVHSGIRFALPEETCDRALGLARLNAISQIDRRSQDMAAALGLARGEVIGAVEFPRDNLGYGGYGLAATHRCGGLFQYYPYALLPFDAKPSVDIVLPLQITYAPQSDENGGLVATGRSALKVGADKAYVVVVPQLFYGPWGPEPLSFEDQTDVIAKLTSIGIASDDIQFSSGRQPSEPVQISVEVALDDLPEIGKRILEAVEEVLRHSETSGVRFGLSEESCRAAISLALRDAASQAGESANGLAEAIGVASGDVVGVAVVSLGSLNYSSTSAESCDGRSQDLLSFDAEPNVEIAVELQISYGISSLEQPNARP